MTACNASQGASAALRPHCVSPPVRRRRQQLSQASTGSARPSRRTLLLLLLLVEVAAKTLYKFSYPAEIPSSSTSGWSGQSIIGTQEAAELQLLIPRLPAGLSSTNFGPMVIQVTVFCSPTCGTCLAYRPLLVDSSTADSCSQLGGITSHLPRRVCNALLPYSNVSSSRYTLSFHNKHRFCNVNVRVNIQQTCVDGSPVTQSLCASAIIAQTSGSPSPTPTETAAASVTLTASPTGSAYSSPSALASFKLWTSASASQTTTVTGSVSASSICNATLFTVTASASATASPTPRAEAVSAGKDEPHTAMPSAGTVAFAVVVTAATTFTITIIIMMLCFRPRLSLLACGKLTDQPADETTCLAVVEVGSGPQAQAGTSHCKYGTSSCASHTTNADSGTEPAAGNISASGTASQANSMARRLPAPRAPDPSADSMSVIESDSEAPQAHAALRGASLSSPKIGQRATGLPDVDTFVVRL